MGGMIVLVSTGLLALIDATALEYVDPTDIAAMIAMSPLVILACAVILTEGIEMAASLWRVERRQVRLGIPETSPRVSIHLPAYNEPPQMVIETLNALARLDYDNYEVIVLDNNTPDPETWRPVEAHCRVLNAGLERPRFRFFHFDNLKGFKGGALNRALALTDHEAVYVAVIDSDYQVQPFWLRRVIPYFAEPSIALVQGPQDYRDSRQSLFKAMAYEEYRGFFHIGMVERNEHNAIIQHGTMTIVRKDRAGGSGWLERMVHHRRHRTGPEAVRGRPRGGLCAAKHGLRVDARHAGSLHDPALSLGLWRHADAQAPCPRDFHRRLGAQLARSAISSCRAGCPGSPTGWAWW